MLCEPCARKPHRISAAGLQDTADAVGSDPKWKVTLASDVQPESPRWLLPGRLPLGAVSVLAGDPGLGKSTLTAAWAAELTTGPDPFNVLMVAPEDSLERVVRPRLEAAGADLSRVGFLEFREDGIGRTLELPGDEKDLREAIQSHAAGLVVIDPVNAHLGAGVDSHKDASLRKALAPLSVLASEHDVTVLCVMHLNKSVGGSALYRLGGSIGYGALARSVLGFARDPDDPEGERGPRRLLSHVKTNCGELMPTLAYQHQSAEISTRAGEKVATHRLVLVGESDRTAEEYSVPRAPTTSATTPREPSRRRSRPGRAQVARSRRLCAPNSDAL